MFTVYNIVAYQVAWFACVLGAACGMPWIGAAVAFTVVAAHLALTRPWAEELKLNHSLRWVVRRPLIATLLGAIGGPLAYLAGAKLGAMHIAVPQTAIPVIGVAWGIAMLALSIVATRWQPAPLPKLLSDEVRDARTQ